MSLKNIIQRQSATSYFITTFAISWLGAFILVASKVFGGLAIPKMDGVLMFPIMIIGPAAASIVLTALTEGKLGLRNLWSRMGKWKLPVRWYLIAMLIPPCLIITVLSLLKIFVSPVFTPNFFLMGILFGIPAGFFEEIGWTGYAFPKLNLKYSVLKSGFILGFLWGLWHLPVIDFLGAATPHREYFLLFSLSFIAILTAMRLIMGWVYSKTNSVLLAQLMHVISTGSLVIFGPSKVSPAQETLWYGLYAVLLWIAVLIIFKTKKHKENMIGFK
ncbi:MAG TPA: CPBP family intramembrane glutamic endopeptidase [Mucilaginibacter sp.]